MLSLCLVVDAIRLLLLVLLLLCHLQVNDVLLKA